MGLTGRIEAIFVGGPKTLTDAKGTWHSSIERQRTVGPVFVTQQGIVGDAVTQPYHGGPDAALCVHLTDHYRFWKEAYAVMLAPGAVGENLTLSGLTEDAVCVGDVVRLGTVLAQVSGPRIPCANLARRVGRPDWVKLTIRENRTGFYLRVLESGSVLAEAAWTVEHRADPEATISAINRCMYLAFDPAYARRMLQMEGLGNWWRTQASDKLLHREAHWTPRLWEDAQVEDDRA